MTKHETADTRPPKGSLAPILLVTGAAAFLIAIVFLVASSVVREELPTFELQSPGVTDVVRDTLVFDTVTVNASSVDQWRFFDFERGTILELPDTTGWDLAFQRFRIIASDGALDLGATEFEAVRRAPEKDYAATSFDRDTVNAALDRWYSYSWITHRLQPRPSVYAIRTHNGHYAKVEFLSYYCTGMAPGCVTFRYAYQGKPTREFR